MYLWVAQSPSLYSSVLDKWLSHATAYYIFCKSKFKYFGNDAISEANVGGRNSDWSSDIVAASLAPFCLNVPGHDLSHASSHVKTTFGTKMQVLAEIVLLTGHGNQGVKIVLIPAIANNTS